MGPDTRDGRDLGGAVVTMKPYYEHAGITIYHGDCLEVLPGLEKVDLVLTDPPYGIGEYENTREHVTPRFLEVAKVAIAFGYPKTIVRWCMESGRLPEAWLVWWPSNAGVKCSRGGTSYTVETEHIAVWGKPSGALPRQPKSTRAIDPAAYKKQPDRRGGDVLRDASPGVGFNSHLRQHPNEKPCSLMKSLAMLGGGTTILDPFMGSGTTLVAAKQLNRRAIGIEIEEKYCEVAAKRLSQEVFDFGDSSQR